MTDLWSMRFHSFGIFSWFKNLRKRIKYSYQRIRRGWADCDTWDLGDYIITIIPEMLNYLSDVTSGYNDSKYSSVKEWKAELNNLAEDFKKANANSSFYKNQYEEEMDRYCIETFKWYYNTKLPKPTNGEIVDKWREVNNNNRLSAKENRAIAFNKLNDCFDDLWD